jgi:hypothetical protein
VLRAGMGAPVPVAEPLTDSGAPAPFVRLRPSGWTTTDAERGVELLGTGTLSRVSGRSIGNSDAKHGTRQLFRVADVGTNRSMDAILKSLPQGGAQEVFGYDVAVAMGIEDLFPRMAWRDDERAAAIEFFDGRTTADYRIATAADLDRAFETMVRTRFPALSEADVVRRAQVERQLVHVYDALLANGDRHQQNILVNRTSGELRMIDHGLINRYPATEGGLVSQIRAAYVQGDKLDDGTRGLQLLPEVREHLAGLDRSALESAFGRMLERIGGSVQIGQGSQPMTTSFLDEVLTRLDSFVATGLVRVRTI